MNDTANTNSSNNVVAPTIDSMNVNRNSDTSCVYPDHNDDNNDNNYDHRDRPVNNYDPATALILAKIRYTQQISDIQINTVRWKTRRQMAWTAFVLIVIFTALMLWVVQPNNIAQFGTVISWFFIAMTSIIAAYVGADAFTYIASLKSGSLPVMDDPSSYNDFAPHQSSTPPLPAPVRRMAEKPATANTPFDVLDVAVASYRARK